MKDPDFLVIGLQKSGTYWVTGLLNSHPEINCIPYLPMGQSGIREGRVFDTLKSIDEDGGKLFKRVFANKHNGHFASIVSQLNKIPRKKLYDLTKVKYNAYCAKYKTKKMIGEKTTEYVWCLDIIDYMYPDIKKICILRNVEDRIVSWHFQQIRKGRIPKSKDVANGLISDYCERVTLEYNSLLEFKKPIHCITYEAMTTNPRPVVKSMLKYLGATASDNILKDIIHKGSFEHRTKISKESKKQRAPGQQAISSHFRKGIVGDGKNYLTDKQRNFIDKSISGLQRKVNRKYGLYGEKI